jgi:hypothetical protein
MFIADLPRDQRSGEAIAIELGIGARPRHRPHVDDEIDTGFPEQIDQLGDRRVEWPMVKKVSVSAPVKLRTRQSHHSRIIVKTPCFNPGFRRMVDARKVGFVSL